VAGILPEIPITPPSLVASCGFCGHNNPHSFQPQKLQSTQELRRTSNRQPFPPQQHTFCALLRPLRPQQHHPIFCRKNRRARKELRLTPSHQPLLPAFPSCALLRLLRPKQHHPIFSRKNRRARKELRLASSRQPFPSGLPFLRPLAAFAAKTTPLEAPPRMNMRWRDLTSLP